MTQVVKRVSKGIEKSSYNIQLAKQLTKAFLLTYSSALLASTVLTEITQHFGHYTDETNYLCLMSENRVKALDFCCDIQRALCQQGQPMFSGSLLY